MREQCAVVVCVFNGQKECNPAAEEDEEEEEAEEEEGEGGSEDLDEFARMLEEELAGAGD